MAGKSPAKKEKVTEVEAVNAEGRDGSSFVILIPLQILLPVNSIKSLTVTHFVETQYVLNKDDGIGSVPLVEERVMASANLQVMFHTYPHTFDSFLSEREEEDDEEEDEGITTIWNTGSGIVLDYIEDSGLYRLTVNNAAVENITQATSRIPLETAAPIVNTMNVSEKNRAIVNRKIEALSAVISKLQAETPGGVKLADDVLSSPPAAAALDIAKSQESRRIAEKAQENRDLLEELMDFFQNLLSKGDSKYYFNPVTTDRQVLIEVSNTLTSSAIAGVMSPVEGLV